MLQIARNVTDVDDGFLHQKRYLTLDRDAKYSEAFRSFLVREGMQVIRLPPRSQNLNAFAERFVRSIKSDCRNRRLSSRRAKRPYKSANVSAECSTNTAVKPLEKHVFYFGWQSPQQRRPRGLGGLPVLHPAPVHFMEATLQCLPDQRRVHVFLQGAEDGLLLRRQRFAMLSRCRTRRAEKR
jgi:transposase InsO family protein